MKNLLKKEFKLSMHPTVPLFLFLSSLLIIPNYPYLVTFFYTTLGIFFTCLSGREDNDVFYTLTLPVRKKDIVRTRFIFVVMVETAQIICAIPFAIIRQKLPLPGNQVGIDANIALFGSALIMLGIFNLIFFSIYYKDVTKVGKAFGWSSIGISIYIIVAETCDHVVPFIRDRLDTKDPEFLYEKLVVLSVGIIIYIAMTSLAYMKSVRSFESLDL
jgi:hypothetical protein